MIHEFDLVLYPRKLWITYDATPKELNRKFPYGDDCGNPFEEESQNYASTYVTADRNKYKGALIVFENKEAMNCKTIAHESVHAAGYICYTVGIQADFKNDEAFAYLTGYIAECCEKIKNK